MAGQLRSGGKGDSLTLRLVQVHASIWVRERAGQETEALSLRIQGGKREDLLSRRFAVPPPVPCTLLGKPALLLLARRQHTAWWLRVCEAC